ncbi:MAG TPA: c-type cytochrome [Flavobacterium sp.]|uniref:c-type cytochrome n=1 Tax=Flavobacterium sp. TaxID=239 RepID=UPI002B4B7FE4|nr:c-type cytochrome [Flavobacterium sp.]HLO74707.1 c-type cytochrome [Flavobacterium sp.]
MKNKTNLFILSGFIAFSSCTSDSVSDLGEPSNLSEVTYTTTVKSIIDNNCIVCHGNSPTNGAPMSLTTYENVKDAVLTRNLLDRISRAEGASGAMPLGGPRLPQNDINAISEWIDANFPQ